MGGRRAVVFIGNSIFGDDAIGLLVGGVLQNKLESEGYDVHVLERTGFALVDCLEGYDEAVVVDSVCIRGVPVGRVAPFAMEEFAAVKPNSPHYSGLPDAVRLMGDLGMSVPKVSVIGINVRDPYALSSEVCSELVSVKDAISDEVHAEILSGRGG